MMIPATPVRRKFDKQLRTEQDVMKKPFDYLSGEQAVFSCAREALFYGIRLLGYTPQKIHVPAYCCRSVLTPLEKLNIKIRFYDIGKHLEPHLDGKEFNKGDILLLVHFFGFPQDILSISNLCRENDMVLVEDCAHTLPEPDNKKPMGSVGAFSIFSLRKQLPVPDGGVLVVNDPRVKEHMESLKLPKLRNISTKRRMVTALDRFAFSAGWPNTKRLKDFLRDIIGLSDSALEMQLLDGAEPEVSPVSLRVLSQIDIGDIIKVRRKNYNYLSDRLSGHDGFSVPFPTLPDGAVPQAFPFLVKDVDRVCQYMHKRGVTVRRWPGPEDMPESVPWTDYPGALSWLKSLMLIPSHQDLNESYFKKMIYILMNTLKK